MTLHLYRTQLLSVSSTKSIIVLTLQIDVYLLSFNHNPNISQNLLWQCLLSHSASTSSAVGKSKSKTRTKTNISREGDKNVNTNKNSENSNNNTKNKKTANGRRQSSLNSFSDSYSFGMDSAKLKCCGRAKSDTCKTLCEKVWITLLIFINDVYLMSLIHSMHINTFYWLRVTEYFETKVILNY